MEKCNKKGKRENLIILNQYLMKIMGECATVGGKAIKVWGLKKKKKIDIKLEQSSIFCIIWSHVLLKRCLAKYFCKKLQQIWIKFAICAIKLSFLFIFCTKTFFKNAKNVKTTTTNALTKSWQKKMSLMGTFSKIVMFVN